MSDEPSDDDLLWQLEAFDPGRDWDDSARVELAKRLQRGRDALALVARLADELDRVAGRSYGEPEPLVVEAWAMLGVKP